VVFVFGVVAGGGFGWAEAEGGWRGVEQALFDGVQGAFSEEVDGVDYFVEEAL
jgi:hypothetical protein